MESKKQTIVAILALIVSTLSFAVSVFVARSQYLEKIEVVADPCYITDIDLESGIVSCQAKVIAANTSHSTTSVLRGEVYSSQSGFHSSHQLESSLGAQLPITLIQGGAEKLLFTFQFLLDDETIGRLKDGEGFAETMKRYYISIRLYSAKNHLYSTSIFIKDAILPDA